LGQRWALVETSFKYHASCRHTHPATDALLKVMQDHQLKADDIAQVTTFVHQGAIDVLGPVVDPQTVHQSKFSMGTVLALAAQYGYAGLEEFERHFQHPRVQQLRDRVQMQLDPEIDAAYPARWIGKVSVKTFDGRELHGRVDEPKGDPGNTLSRSEIDVKAMRLALFSHAATQAEMTTLLTQLWGIRSIKQLSTLLP
jgi:2-methylcitrate dehydratase PrpD